MTTVSTVLDHRGRAGSHASLCLALQADRPHGPVLRRALAGFDEIVIGRAEHASCVVRRDASAAALVLGFADARLSGQHLRLSRLGKRWVLEDAGSKNGTFVNGSRVQRVTLDDGDIVEAGHCFFVYREHDTAPVDLDGAPTEVARGLATLSPPLADLWEQLERAAASLLPIVLLGETGTGKELAARAVHSLSRRSGAFVALNCGALPTGLVENELFGHRKGAFSGADAERAGLFRSAEAGTLFLDELGELPAPAQAALLRALQEYEVQPLGSDRAVSVDVRVVAATNREPEHDPRFRSDLWARVAGVVLRLPPLRERREDIGLLVTAHLASAPHAQLSLDAARALFAYAWPRNIRELERALTGALVLAGDQPITLAHLPPALRGDASVSGVVEAVELSVEDAALRDRLVSALAEHDGNISAISRALGKDRTQIRRWLRRFGLGET